MHSKLEAAAFVAVLKDCAKTKDLLRGIRVHEDIQKTGLLDKNLHLASTLVIMYAKCGSVGRAQHVVDALPVRDVATWNALIAGYVQQGQGKEALVCFDKMSAEGLAPTAISFTSILKACAKVGAADKGKQIHDKIVHQGLLKEDIVLGNALVDMYVKCGKLKNAQKVVTDELPFRDVVSWSALISGYAQHGQGKDAWKCFKQMKREGISPNAVTFACLLKACGSIYAADKGKAIHDEIVKQGMLRGNIILGNALVDMYVKCGAFAQAQEVLDKLDVRDAITWSPLLAGYVQQGQGNKSLLCFERMQQDGLVPDPFTFACILRACGSIRAVDKGEQIHDEIVRRGLLGNDNVLGNSLVDMYAKSGELSKAQKVLYELPVRDEVSWCALMAGYAQFGQGEEALDCFHHMQLEGIFPGAITFACALKACGIVGTLAKGEDIHDEIVKQDLLKDSDLLSAALVDMYAKCGELSKAQQVVDELPVEHIVSWNTLITGYVQHEQCGDALNCLDRMQHGGPTPDMFTFSCCLKACGCIGAVDKGMQIHHEIVHQGLLGEDIVLDNALVDMYAKCGMLAKAYEVLMELPVQNMASWKVLIEGYAQDQLQAEDESFSCVLKSNTIRTSCRAAWMNDEATLQGLLGKISMLGTTLVHMYIKHGMLCKAEQVLSKLHINDATSWNLVIAGYTQQGQGKEALNCFERMQRMGVFPNEGTLTCVLSACSHSGLMTEGQMYYSKLSEYGIASDFHHHTCMVDLFARAGHFNEALAVIKLMPSTEGLPLWSTMLAACRKWENVRLGKWAFDHAVRIDQSDAAAYVCMINIYSAAGMLNEANKIIAMRTECKVLGQSGWIADSE